MNVELGLKFLFLFFVLLLLQSEDILCKSTVDDLQLFLHFSEEELDREIDSSAQPIFVAFYVPWSKEWEGLRSVWRQLFLSESKATVGVVNCFVQSDLCVRFGVQNFPTLKFLYDAQVSQYDGQWELPEFRKFISENGQSAVSLPVPRKGQVLGSQNELKRDVKRVEMKMQEAEQMQAQLRQELEKKQKILDDQKLQLIAQKQFLEQQKKNLEETRKKQNAKKVQIQGKMTEDQMEKLASNPWIHWAVNLARELKKLGNNNVQY